MAIRKPESYETLIRQLQERADRRQVMAAGASLAVGGAALASGTGIAYAQGESTPGADATPDICVLTPELTEGPFYVDDVLVRTDITHGRAGVPLSLKISVLNPNTCSAIENAAVDIWHCDALGYYSGVQGNQPGPGDPIPGDIDTIPMDTFLRGVQLTDAEGNVEFQTIYPGWYQGRAIHIHMKVFTGGEVEDDGTTATDDDTYAGGHTSHTGQLFFDEAMNDVVFANEPYSTRVTTRLANADDNILGDHEDEPGFMLDMQLLDESDVTKGIVATITVGVDPSVTRSDNGDGFAMGGGAPSDGGPGGNPPGQS
jgi:protocatechuate 3,4-dioxygenase beta subunit